MTAYDTSWAEFSLCPKCANVPLRKGDIVAQGTRRDHCAVCREPLDKAHLRVWAFASGADAARDNVPYILREIV
jgi:hypothetical protein